MDIKHKHKVTLLDKLPYKANSTQDSKLFILKTLIMEVLKEVITRVITVLQVTEEVVRLIRANNIILLILEEVTPNNPLFQDREHINNNSNIITQEPNQDNNSMVTMEAVHNTSIIIRPVAEHMVVPPDIINLSRLTTITISELEYKGVLNRDYETPKLSYYNAKL